jgi:cation diffusion facilitator CzcD-associated flavoprotein CzcO
MGSIDTSASADFDVLIIGAGISGINAAYRVQTELPAYKYAILESRNAIGGTWDLFRYPGIRSDSDLHTFGFVWRPWSSPKSIADGESIRTYVKESAEQYGIDQKIKFHHKVLAGDWSSADQRWNLTVDNNGDKKTFSARFMILSTGYYDYNEPLKADIPGIDKFHGQVIHPQFWPEGLDYSGKKIVVIGSGATAITLIPSLADNAAKVTMLQRSPTYIMALPTFDLAGNWMRRWLPSWFASKLVRWQFLVLPFIFFKFCKAFPNAGKKLIRANNKKFVPPSIPLDPTFKPSYNPWDQRLCVCPDGDFFKSLQKGKADVVTDTIKNVTGNGIQTEGGKFLDADIIVTATGLKMQLAGGMNVSVDGKAILPANKYIWKGVMLQDLPNAAFIVGYTNASWTLGADVTAKLVCRLLKRMDANKQSSAVPRVPEGKNLKPVQLLNLNSTYIEKAKGTLPMGGDIAPWKPRANYLVDHWTADYGNLTADLEFTKDLKAKAY